MGGWGGWSVSVLPQIFRYFEYSNNWARIIVFIFVFTEFSNSEYYLNIWILNIFKIPNNIRICIHHFWKYENYLVFVFVQKSDARFCQDMLNNGSRSSAVLPRIMNFGRIRIPNNIHIFKNDKYKYEYYSKFKKLFEYYSWEILE